MTEIITPSFPRGALLDLDSIEREAITQGLRLAADWYFEKIDSMSSSYGKAAARYKSCRKASNHLLQRMESTPKNDPCVISPKRTDPMKNEQSDYRGIVSIKFQGKWIEIMRPRLFKSRSFDEHFWAIDGWVVATQERKFFRLDEITGFKEEKS